MRDALQTGYKYLKTKTSLVLLISLRDIPITLRSTGLIMMGSISSKISKDFT